MTFGAKRGRRDDGGGDNHLQLFKPRAKRQRTSAQNGGASVAKGATSKETGWWAEAGAHKAVRANPSRRARPVSKLIDPCCPPSDPSSGRTSCEPDEYDSACSENENDKENIDDDCDLESRRGGRGRRLRRCRSVLSIHGAGYTRRVGMLASDANLRRVHEIQQSLQSPDEAFASLKPIPAHLLGAIALHKLWRRPPPVRAKHYGYRDRHQGRSISADDADDDNDNIDIVGNTSEGAEKLASRMRQESLGDERGDETDAESVLDTQTWNTSMPGEDVLLPLLPPRLPLSLYIDMTLENDSEGESDNANKHPNVQGSDDEREEEDRQAERFSPLVLDEVHLPRAPPPSVEEDTASTGSTQVVRMRWRRRQKHLNNARMNSKATAKSTAKARPLCLTDRGRSLSPARDNILAAPDATTDIDALAELFMRQAVSVESSGTGAKERPLVLDDSDEDEPDS